MSQTGRKNMTVSVISGTGAATENGAKIPTVVTGYDNEKHNGRNNANISQPKFIRSDMADVPVQQAAGSTLPLVITRKKGGDDSEDVNYNPFEHRKVEHPTSDMETLVHLLKGSLGSGILAMPMAFMNAGLWFGLVATFAVGALCTYCVHILVKCAHILCRRRKIPMMGFADVAEQAFLDGPPSLNRWSRFIRFMVNSFLVIDLLGCCCIYLVFVATNVKQVVDFYMENELSVRLWIVIVTGPLIFMCLVRNLKFLTPFSMIANILMFVGIIITFIYMFSDLPAPAERDGVVNVVQWPLFFGTVIFALEGIGVVMSLENDMKNPTHFIGCPSVLNLGMGVVIALYTLVGFFGYLKYGPGTEASITLNLPVEEKLAQSVKLMIAIAIFFTFTLQFYVPVSILWKGIANKIAPERQNASEYGLRVFLVIVCCSIAVALPNLGPFISLIGAVCLSTLGMIVPAIIELAVYHEDPGYGRFNWRLCKNIGLILFGIVGFVTGTYISILEFHAEFTGGHVGDH
ncbi:proton-coupled amino acid transporter-like protein CG1139 isoform X1 [Scaptodrosophila lebanonensis]|uniref:Proton-coupled amino acid transporter-like protein CG1139 isoform X1 n=1 Tax=Drosophila lebanonensis TaxID=7225 RepID=A0A6J2T9B1_DROLE|nr:proton-coupled amino acid transporter-like protein CG1139 isoform X1 [Scaptodrosophila lebanonensis]